jgi:hypothetical protein
MLRPRLARGVDLSMLAAASGQQRKNKRESDERNGAGKSHRCVDGTNVWGGVATPSSARERKLPAQQFSQNTFGRLHYAPLDARDIGSMNFFLDFYCWATYI